MGTLTYLKEMHWILQIEVWILMRKAICSPLAIMIWPFLHHKFIWSHIVRGASLIQCRSLYLGTLVCLLCLEKILNFFLLADGFWLFLNLDDNEAILVSGCMGYTCLNCTQVLIMCLLVTFTICYFFVSPGIMNQFAVHSF